MRELSIQAEVGRRLREVIGRAHPNHALRTNSDSRMIEEIVASGMFTSKDASALTKMHVDTLRALHKKFAGMKPPKDDDDEEIEDVKTTDDDEVAVMANMGRTGKALERQNQRHALSARTERMRQPRYFQVANGVTDDEAIGMLPPTPTFKRKGR